MPQLGESVTEGTIGRWLKAVGERVERYEPMVEVVTDKVNAEVPAPIAGTLTAIIAQEGETLAVGQAICEIAGAADLPVDQEGQQEPAPQAQTAPPAAATTAGARSPDEPGKPRSSPLVRRLAQEAGVSLASVPGSGPGGRVTREDLERHIAQSDGRAASRAPAQAPTAATPAAPQASAAAPVAAPAAMGGDRYLDLTPMRRAIAEHMVRSKRESPHATSWFEVDMSRVVALRSRLRAEFEAREGVPLTFLPFVTKAAVEALKEFPEVNSSWGGERIILHGAVHVGIAVAVPDGLVVPVIRSADSLSIAGIARAAHDLITRARQARLTRADIEGGTFTVNNPGAYGSVFSTPVINQPQAAILSMESIVKRPVVVEGDAIAVRSMMFLSFSFDHRILDGATANRYLGSVRQRLEQMGPETAVY